MFGLSLIIGLPAFLVTVLILVGVGLGAYAAVTGNLSQDNTLAVVFSLIGGSVLLICCLSLVMLVVGLIVEQAYNALVLEDRRLLDSLGRGWEVFSKNWLAVVIVGVVQSVLSFMISIVQLIVDLIILAPMLVVVVLMVVNQASFAAEASRGMFIAFLLVLGCTAIILIPFSIWFNGLRQTYFQTMWTLSYRRLTGLNGPELPARIEIIAPE